MRKPFAEDHLRAVRLGAAELTDDEAERDGPVAEGEISNRAPVTAVDAARRRAAARAGSRRGRGGKQGDGGGWGQDEVIQAQLGAGKEINRQHRGHPIRRRTCEERGTPLL